MYTHTTTGDLKVLDVPPPISNDSYPILREEVEAAVKSLKKGKSAGVDKIPSELIQSYPVRAFLAYLCFSFDT